MPSRFFGSGGGGFTQAPPGFFGDDEDNSADSGFSDEAGANAHQLRNASMNSFGAPAGSRPAQRLHNTNKSGLGNGNAGAGWAFGAPSSAFGGLGGAPGLGPGRPGQLSGFAQVMGGGGGQGPIDMSDFPSLSGAPRPQHPASSWNSNVIRQQPIQQQQAAPQPSAIHQQPQAPPSQRAPSAAPSHQSIDQQQLEASRSQQQTADRAGGSGDDFPPLSAQPNGEPLRQANGFGTTLNSPDNVGPTNGQHTQLPMRGAQSVFAASPQAPVGANQAANPPQPSARLQDLSDEEVKEFVKQVHDSKPWGDMTPAERFGMVGLGKRFTTLKAIETNAPIDPTLPPQEKNVGIFMGQDLSTLGMDLDSPEPLHKTFHAFPDHSRSGGSIFDDRSRRVVPEFTVPQAYYVSNVPAMSTRMSAFGDETLFSIFFQSPGDIKQELAAAELARRDWRWHKGQRVWLQQDTRESNSAGSLTLTDGAAGIPVGMPPTRLPDGKTEQGVYIFFDHLNWQRLRREFALNIEELDMRGATPRADGLQHNEAAAMASLPQNTAGGYPGAGRQNSIISAGPDP